MDMLNYMMARKTAGGGGGDITTQSLSVSANGQYVAPSGKAYTPVNVNVQPTLQSKTATANGTVTPDQGYDGLSSVSVNVTPSLSALSVTSNGTYTPSGYDGYSQVTVDVQGGGGDHDAEDGIIQGTISGTYVNSRLSMIRVEAFINCNKLSAVDIRPSNLVSVLNSAFKNCSRMKSVTLNTNYLGDQAFEACYALNTVSLNFGSSMVINTSAFKSCRSLLSLYLYGPSVALLTNSNAFSSTPIAGYTASTGGAYGSIYVPASLVSGYLERTNWAYFSDRFVAIDE